MKESDKYLLLDNQLCFALYAASRAMTAAYRPYLDPLGITYPQYLVLLVLWENQSSAKSTTVKALGGRLNLDSGTLTPLLKRMETNSLLERTRSPQDEREVLIRLTSKGLTLKKQARKIPVAMAESGDLSLKEINNLRDQLKILLKSLTPA